MIKSQDIHIFNMDRKWWKHVFVMSNLLYF